jgi:hypothetical protein
MFTNEHKSGNLSIYDARRNFNYNGPCHGLLSKYAAHVVVFQLAHSLNDKTLN